jgi:hypothetical protein
MITQNPTAPKLRSPLIETQLRNQLREKPIDRHKRHPELPFL